MTPREEIIDTELTMAFISANEKLPPHWDKIVKSWSKQLEDIPVNRLQDCFLQAVKENHKFKTVAVGQVWQAWKELRAQKDDSPFNAGMEDGRAPYIRRGTYETFDSMPFVYCTDEILWLRYRKRRGELTPEDEIRIQDLKKVKFWVEDLRPRSPERSRYYKYFAHLMTGEHSDDEWMKIANKVLNGELT